MRSNAKFQVRYSDFLLFSLACSKQSDRTLEKSTFQILLDIATSGFQSHTSLSASQTVGGSIPPGQVITHTH